MMPQSRTKSLNDMDKDKYENDLYYTQIREEKVQGRGKRIGKQYLQVQKKKKWKDYRQKKLRAENEEVKFNRKLCVIKYHKIKN